MQTRQAYYHETAVPACCQNSEDRWRILRGSGRGRQGSRRQIRRWKAVRIYSASAIMAFAPLILLVWLGISMLDPRNHFLAGAAMLMILAAEASAVIAYLISGLMLQHLRHRRSQPDKPHRQAV